MVDKITPNDSRIQWKTANINGQTSSYILAEPASGTPINHTIFLIHGWPDMAFGWRYQIPLLTSLGLRVVVPNMLGYSQSSAPDPAERYTYKNTADDIAALADIIGVNSIILGGHDWGGAIVYRVALYYPKLISALISICTPFSAPQKTYINAAKVLPNFAYQNQLASTEVESKIVGEEKIRQFINTMYGGRTSSGEIGFSTDVGLHFSKLPDIGPTPLLNKEEVDFYVKEYTRNGLHGPLNWYRTGELNFADEKDTLVPSFEQGFQFQIPVLFVAGKKDAALPPSMSKGMDKFFTDLKREEVDAGHWALSEKPVEVNKILKEFLSAKVLGGSKSSL